MKTFKMDSEHTDMQPNYSEGRCTSDWNMSSAPQVGVDAVGQTMQLIGNHTHFPAIQE